MTLRAIPPSLPPALLPPDVVSHCVSFDPHHGDLAADSELPAQLRRAIPSRKREFVAGRQCAREAIRTLMLKRADEPVPLVGIGARREPLWPDEVVGSLTHSHGLAIAAVARAADYSAIGIDSEPLLPEATAAEVAAQIATATELESLERTMTLSRGQIVTVLFSAKETLFKCLNPLVGRFFDFLDARVLDVDLTEHTFQVQLLLTLSPAFVAGTVLSGTVAAVHDHVYTAMVLRRPRPLRAVDD